MINFVNKSGTLLIDLLFGQNYVPNMLINTKCYQVDELKNIILISEIEMATVSKIIFGIPLLVIILVFQLQNIGIDANDNANKKDWKKKDIKDYRYVVSENALKINPSDQNCEFELPRKVNTLTF